MKGQTHVLDLFLRFGLLADEIPKVEYRCGLRSNGSWESDFGEQLNIIYYPYKSINLAWNAYQQR